MPEDRLIPTACDRRVLILAVALGLAFTCLAWRVEAAGPSPAANTLREKLVPYTGKNVEIRDGSGTLKSGTITVVGNDYLTVRFRVSQEKGQTTVDVSYPTAKVFSLAELPESKDSTLSLVIK